MAHTWFEAKVKANLHGLQKDWFRMGSTVFVFRFEVKGANQEWVTVWNNIYAMRVVTPEQARECLEIGPQLSEHRARPIEARYLWELKRK